MNGYWLGTPTGRYRLQGYFSFGWGIREKIKQVTLTLYPTPKVFDRLRLTAAPYLILVFKQGKMSYPGEFICRLGFFAVIDAV